MAIEEITEDNGTMAACVSGSGCVYIFGCLLRGPEGAAMTWRDFGAFITSCSFHKGTACPSVYVVRFVQVCGTA
jgi:hypothetical protein